MASDMENFRTQMHILQGSTSAGPDPNLFLENRQQLEDHVATPSDSDDDIYCRRTSRPKQASEEPGVSVTVPEVTEPPSKPRCYSETSSYHEDNSRSRLLANLSSRM